MIAAERPAEPGVQVELRCSCRGCERPAVAALRTRIGTPDERVLAACESHEVAMVRAYRMRLVDPLPGQ